MRILQVLSVTLMLGILFYSCSKTDPANPVASSTGDFSLSVSVSPASAGVVQKSPNAGTYAAGTPVAIKAVPASGYVFMYWSGDAAGNDPSIAILVDGNKSVTAVFAQLTAMPDSMVSIPGGTFQMGMVLRSDTVHSVTISHFRISRTEVTQGEYQKVMGRNPSYFIGNPMLPVETVSWFDAVLYCNNRSKLEGKDTVYSFSGVVNTVAGCDGLVDLQVHFERSGYRLPTEAEWEYACRAGTTTDYYWGKNYPPITPEDTLAIDSNAVCDYNANSTQPVASKKPNAFGLYDMSGNVWEWVNDYYYGNYTASAQTDPTGPMVGYTRRMRGGGDGNVFYFISAFRGGQIPFFRSQLDPYDQHYEGFGFRPVCRP